MKEKKMILVICALGYATSTMIKRTIEGFLEKNKIQDWYVEAIGLNMSRGLIKDAAIIVSSLDLSQEDYEVPVVNGVSLISGIDKEDTLNKILQIIKEH